jgi:hypothetical protein
LGGPLALFLTGSRKTQNFSGNWYASSFASREMDDMPLKGQVARGQIFDGLLARLDEQAG